MKLQELLAGLSRFSNVVFDTRQIRPGCVFVAIRGGKHDGHRFLKDAVTAGATALVVEDADAVPRDVLKSPDISVVKVASTRVALAQLAASLAGNPSENLFTIGVTGTNGKTTTTNMIEAVLTRGGYPTGVIGTIDHHLGAKTWASEMTTPDPIAFQGRLRDFVQNGAKAVALEVSSHALDQARVEAVQFDVGIFTNLTRDHLDYHGTMENYFEAKQNFFTDLLVRSSKSQTAAIINVDDAWGAKLAHELLHRATSGLAKNNKPRVWTFAREGTPRVFDQSRTHDFEYEILAQGFGGVKFRLRSPAGNHVLNLAMAGLHNVQNAIGAFAAGLTAGLDIRVVCDAIENIRGVHGRLEPVPNTGGLHIFVDYAHTDDALTTVLRLLGSIRESAIKYESGSSTARARILTVFGCGGDRDRGKRPLMMAAALRGSDAVIVTSDNPRTEDPEKIIDDAMAAVGPSDQAKVHRVVDRRRAIARALEMARAGDVILIAGKGHEATQTIGTVKLPFSDAQVARELMEEKYGPGK